MCHLLYDKAKKLIARDVCMKFYSVLKPLNLEADASGVGHGTGLLQAREGMNGGHDKVLDKATLHPIAFASKSLSRVVLWQH